MPVPRGKKRKSDLSTASMDGQTTSAEPALQKIATKAGDETEGNPRKKRKLNLTLAQKQALIDNLQLEITERARKLRAHYNIHAQSLRTRIEIRVNRIPLSLRKLRMGELLAKHSAEQRQKATAPTASAFRPPPVSAKDAIAGRPVLQRGQARNAPIVSPARLAKRPSDDISGGDKENAMTHIDIPNRKPRAVATGATRAPNPSQVLSPTSSNSRMLPPRERATVVASPGRSLIARPVSPTKPSTANSGMFSNMVEKARSTRAAATARKATASSTASSSNGSAAAPATRSRRGAAAPAPAPAPVPSSRAGATSRATRRVSGISESSDGSTGTVVRKRSATAAAPPALTTKRTVMGTIRKGVTGAATKKATAAKAAPAAPASTGRVLRKRN